jgi:hypothetical protein
MDIYQSFLAGQSVVLPPGLPDGLYCLSTVVDPIDQLGCQVVMSARPADVSCRPSWGPALTSSPH